MHLESENNENMIIWFVIPQKPPFGTGTDALCAILFGDICKKNQNYNKVWPPGGHLESENDENILIRFVITQNPPLGIETDTLCTILLEDICKNVKITGKNGRQMAILNLRILQISSFDSSYLKIPHLELERILYVQYF